MDTTATIRATITPDSATRIFQLGMTLVELLVAMVIGLGVTLAVATLLVAGENHKRTTTSTNDADQTGSYAAYALDRALRGAGSAIVESAYGTDQGVLTCKLNATAGATSILPRNGAFPAPFAAHFLSGATGNLRVAPVLIGKSAATPNEGSDDGQSDVLVVMGGSGAAGGVSRPNYGTGTVSGSSASLVLASSVGFLPYDLALVSETGQTSTPDCLLEEVSQTFVANTLPLTLSGTYYRANGAITSLTTMAADVSNTYITPLGNAQANNVQFQLFGVGTNYTLYTYDLLQNQRLVQGFGGDVSQPVADGVIRMNAIYGTVIAGVQGWADAGITPGYDINTVMTTEATMKTIIAVRVALVVRGQYYDKNLVSPTSLTIFNGLTDINGNAISQQVTLPDQHYRYRVFEFTVPLRNMLVLLGI